LSVPARARRLLRSIISSGFVASAAACLCLSMAGSLPGEAATMTVAVSPTAATVATGGTACFTATVTNYVVTTVYWTVDGVRNGAASVGTITGTGNTITYTAPATGGTHTVTAVSTSFASMKASATVTVTEPPMTVAISPASATVNTGASLSFTGTVSNYVVTTVYFTVDGVRNGSAAAGTITGTGNTVTYTAPASPGTHTVTAVSTSFASMKASAAVTVTVPAVVTSVAVTPATLSLNTGAQKQFQATVTGTGNFNPAVAWSAQRGTITSAGLYTAPPDGGNDVVTATSVQTPGATGSCAVTVIATAPVAPVLSGPTELQAGAGPYTASIVLLPGLSAQWTLTGGTILSGAASSTVQFDAGGGPNLTLTCKVTNSAGSASASRWMVALPFAPRNYLADLKNSLAANSGAIAAQVATGNPAIYYSTSYYLNGLAAGAQASGDTQVMDTLVGYVTQMIARAQPLVRNGVTYPEWGPWDVNGNPQQLNTFQGASALARTAAVIAGNPVFRARYSAQLPQIVAFVDQSIFKYWFDKQTGIYANPSSSYLGGIVPWLPSSLGGWGEYHVWVDKCSLFGMTSAWMYQATRNPLYLEYATRIAQGFRTHVTVVNGCWIWDDGAITTAWDSYNLDGSPDTSHANREPMMAASMYEAGIGFQLADLQAMARTFTTRIWNQSQSNPMFANYIDGGNAAYGPHAPWTNGNIYLGWNALGRYDPATELALALSDQIIQTQPPSSLNLSLDSNATSYGVVELAGTQALNLSR